MPLDQVGAGKIAVAAANAGKGPQVAKASDPKAIDPKNVIAKLAGQRTRTRESLSTSRRSIRASGTRSSPRAMSQARS